jgi:hypothetical protein
MDHYLNAKHNTGKKGFVDTARTMFLLPVDCISQWSVLLIYVLKDHYALQDYTLIAYVCQERTPLHPGLGIIAKSKKSQNLIR